MYNVPIPNMLNGISQQPPPVRFPTQAERQVNAYSSAVEGLTKRFPTEYVTKMKDQTDPGYSVGSLGYKFHVIDRGDGVEAYGVLARKAPDPTCTACVKIYDLKNDGAEVPVLYGSSAAEYLVGTAETSYQDIELVSVADYTFIVNKSKTVSMTNATSPESGSEGCILWVAGTGYGQTYTVKLKLAAQSEVEVRYTTSDTSFHNQAVTVDGEAFPDKSSTIDSSYVAANLKVALEANATVAAGYNITRNGFAIFIKPKVAGTDFTINVTDGQSGTDLRVAKDSVNAFQDLPIQAPHNFVLKIEGQPEEERDDYYVKFKQSSLNTTRPGSGVWEETVEPGVLTTIDAETMPHGLIRYFDNLGNPFFVFKAFDGATYSVNGNPLEGSDISWGTRQVGSTRTNPIPSFVGGAISDIFIFKNRLGLLSGENVVLSEVGEYFNFFRTTVTTLLDSDIIDVGSAYPGVTLFHAAVPYLDRLILFADKVQMSIQSSGGALTAKSVSLSVVSNYDYLKSASPAPISDIVFFPFDRGGYTGIRNMEVTQTDSAILTAPDISAHVPQYIGGKAIYMEASDHDNILAVLADSDASRLYIYKWFDNDRQRVQSSWSEWHFGDGEIIGFGFEQSTMWIAFRHAEGIFLEKIVIETDRKDEGSEFVVRLDRRSESCPFLVDGKLYVDFPFFLDQIDYGSGKFAEFSVTNTTFQGTFDTEPLTLTPGGEVFSSVEDIPADGLTNYGSFSGNIDLPSVSGECYFHSKFAYTLPAGASLDLTLPSLGIDVNTGYVNTAGRQASMKVYFMLRTHGGVVSHHAFGDSSRSPALVGGLLTAGWDFVETVGQFSGTASFSNPDPTNPLRIEVVFEKAVDLIPDVLVYDESDTFKYSIRPGLANGEITNETITYLVGDSLFRTSPLSSSELDGYTPPPFDPAVDYRADQWADDFALPPGYAANDSSFFAIQDDGDLCIGLYLRGAQEVQGLTATSIGNTGYFTNTSLPEYPTGATFNTGVADNVFLYKGMTSGDSATFSIDSLPKNLYTPFRWLSFTGRDTTVLGNGLISILAVEPQISGAGVSPYQKGRPGPIDTNSEGIPYGVDQSLLPLLEEEDNAALFLFASFDPVTGEELLGCTFYGTFDWWSNCLYMEWGCLWGQEDTFSFPYTLADWNGNGLLPGTDPNSWSYTFSSSGTTYAWQDFYPDDIPEIGGGTFYGVFARGPLDYPENSVFQMPNAGNSSSTILFPYMEIKYMYDVETLLPFHNVKTYVCSYDYSTASWTKIVVTNTGVGNRWYSRGVTVGLPPSSSSGGQFAYQTYTFSPAISLDTDSYPIYPTWWATEESTNSTPVSVYKAVVGPGVASIPVTMGTWALNNSGGTDSQTALNFPYGITYTGTSTGQDSGVAPEVFFDEFGQPEITVTPTGTRVRMVYPFDGGQYSIDGICYWIGVPYTMEYEFSTPYMKNGENTITSGRTQIRNMAIEYDKAGYFEVEVYDRESGQTLNYEKDLSLGFIQSRFPTYSGIDTPNLTNGSFKFGVLSKNVNTRVTIKNDSVVPARFLSAEWELSYNARSRRI
jgi:hypothetical protein